MTQDPTRPLRAICVATLVVTCLALAWSLRIAPGDPLFYPATMSLALIQLAGALAARAVGRRARVPRPADEVPLVATSRPLLARWAQHHLFAGLSAGVSLLLVFLVGAGVVAQVPALRDPVHELLDHARLGSLPVVLAITALNGIAEELFYRGALYDAWLRARPVVVTSVVYTLVTAASGVPLLALAALLLGIACALLRRATSGLLAPVVCHLVWSIGMLLLLPHALTLMEAL